jgi:hypothetical protein
MEKKFFFIALIATMIAMTSCSFFDEDHFKDMDPGKDSTHVDPPLPKGEPFELLTNDERTDGLDSLRCTTKVSAVVSTVDTLFRDELNAALYMLNYGNVEEGINSNRTQGKFIVTDYTEFCKVSLASATDSLVWKDSLKSSSVFLNLSDTSYTYTKGTWTVSKADKQIGTETHPIINGKNYIALPVVITMYYKYTATSGYCKGTNNLTSSLTHTVVFCMLDSIQGRRDTVENESYVFNANVMNAGMTSTLSSTINENSYDNVVKVYDDVQSRVSVREPMNLTVNARLSKPSTKVRNIGEPVSITTHTTDLKTTSDVVTANGLLKRKTSFAEHYGFDDGQVADFDCSYENLMQDNQPFMGYTEITSVSLLNAFIEVDGSGNVKMNPRVLLKKHDIDGSITPDEKEMELVYVQEEEDYVLYTFVESSVTPSSTNSFTATANFYEQWNQSGRRLITTKTATLNASLTAQNGSDVIVDNVSFSTTGNGLNGTGSGTYTDNATNGTVNFTNTYLWSADGSVTLTYDTLSATFTANFVLTEAGQTIGSATTSSDGRYTLYPYSNKVQAVYTVNAQSLNLSATAERSLLIKKEAEDVVDGEILGVNLTYVPVRPGTLVGGSGEKVPAKCFAIDRNLNGQIQKVLVITPTSTVFPTATEIASNGVVVDGDFRNRNSAEYRPYGWIPATAHDRSGSDTWRWTAWTGDETVIAATTVAEWGWNISTPIISEFQVIDNGDGTFVLKMNGASVLWK